MNQPVFKCVLTGVFVFGAVGLITSILLITNTPSYPSIPISTKAARLMTEHMQLHHKIDKKIDSQEDMIKTIVRILKNMLPVKEGKSE